MTTADSPDLSADTIVLDTITALIQGQLGTVSLSLEEAAAIRLLLGSADQVSSRERLERVFRLQAAGPFALAMRISRLRKKLKASGAVGPCVVAVRPNAYRLCCRVHIAGGPDAG
jgi:DNA-binding response OmpR family regulator